MKKCVLPIVAILMLACTNKAEKGTIIIDVNILDVTTGEIQEHKDVVIDSGRIKSISEHQMNPKPYETMVNGKDQYLMPGLSEMHAHVPHPSENNEQIEDVLFLYLANGITTIRGMLGHPTHLVLRNNAESGELPSPRIFTSSPSLNGKSVTSVEDAISVVTTYQKDGYDFLKIHPGIKREVFDQVVKTAKKVGIPFAGHVPVDVGIRHALESHYASIDHIDGFLEGLVPESANVKPGDNGFFGYAFTPLADTSKIDGLVAMTKENKVWIVPTQSLFERWFAPITADELLRQPEMQYMPPKTLADWKKRKIATTGTATGFKTEQWLKFDAIRKQLIQKLQKGGVGMLLGSDAPQVFNVPGFSIHREIDGLLAAGLTPLEIIQSGTINPAKFFNKEGVFGQVKEGLEADLILLNANPLDDMDNLKDLSAVFRKGHFIPKVEINKRLAEIAKKNGHTLKSRTVTEKRDAPLNGTWKYYSRKGKKPAASATFTRIKTLANGYWSMSETNILTNKLDSYQGGRYLRNDTIFSETNTFANSNSLYLLGETQLFELEVKKDTLIQTGIDNDTDEVWIRVE
ncbi:amidohydrolase family protein [Maribacter polysiphoniae]|uniref:amidohydrolase family protein n=1 Tax=Maribacter polysiphoniae TaxID=429344 RepID=UPI0023573057|nr:amidohydrolase family protein [Maribacter polysiphoniae]